MKIVSLRSIVYIVGELDIIIIAENLAVSDIDGDYHRSFSQKTYNL